MVRDNCHDYINGSALDKENFDFEIWNKEIFVFWNAAGLPPGRETLVSGSSSSWGIILLCVQRLTKYVKHINISSKFSRTPPEGAAPQLYDA